MGKILRTVRIRQCEEAFAKKNDEYREGCLILTPKERIAEMRALSRRIILLNPKNPRSPHIDKSFVRITHDALEH